MCAKLPTMLTRRVVLQTTLTISNMPGPIEPVTFSGNPIVLMFPTVTRIPQVNVQSIIPRTGSEYRTSLMLLSIYWCTLAMKFSKLKFYLTGIFEVWSLNCLKITLSCCINISSVRIHTDIWVLYGEYYSCLILHSYQRWGAGSRHIPTELHGEGKLGCHVSWRHCSRSRDTLW
jgi:hypothetical protein